jgi:hypothetical protein
MAVILLGASISPQSFGAGEKIMRIVVAMLCTLSLLAGLSGEASARAYEEATRHAQVRQPASGRQRRSRMACRA